jgi:hypothetical protein
MPFVSKAQARKFFATKPGMAKEWAAATPSIKALPERAPGSSLMAASRRRRRPRRVQLGTPPQANGQAINGASLSTTRIGY